MKNGKKLPKQHFHRQNTRELSHHPMPFKKKALGQHFLRKQSTVDNMINKVTITSETSVLEIGCGDGFLTQSILTQTPCKQLIVYEIDPEWAGYVKNLIKEPRLKISIQNILEVHFDDEMRKHMPLVVLANLPYQITFPIFFLFQKYRALFQEGVVMIQEEVAQKIIATDGRSFNPTSIFLQQYFEFELLEKVEPGAFSPPPKVYSRLLYFKPKKEIVAISDEEGFWKFLKLCFKSPRQTLRNNLKSTHYMAKNFSSELLSLRAQQVSFEDFLQIWKQINS